MAATAGLLTRLSHIPCPRPTELTLCHGELVRAAWCDVQVHDSPLKVAVEHLRDQPYNPSEDHLKATTLEIVSTLKELLHLHPLYNEQLRSFAAFGSDFHDLSRLTDMGASLTSADEAALQGVLEELTVPAR